MNMFDELAMPFDPRVVHWRIGQKSKKNPKKAMVLAYVDARDVMKRLDAVVGPDGWQCRYPFEGCCEIGIKCGDEWVWKANAAGTTQVEAEKGQASDAFKRAAVLWGIGRYLYYLKNSWVDLKNEYGDFDPPPLPEWATPEGYKKLKEKQS